MNLPKHIQLVSGGVVSNLESDSRAYTLDLFSRLPPNSVMKFPRNRDLDYISS